MSKLIKKTGLIGGGVIGSGWGARLLLNGVDVKVFDPSDTADARIIRTYWYTTLTTSSQKQLEPHQHNTTCFCSSDVKFGYIGRHICLEQTSSETANLPFKFNFS